MNASAAQASQPVQQVTIDERNDGQRIDNFLHARLKGVPRSRIYRLLRTGQVRVNKGRTRQDYRLRSGDVVRIPPVRHGESMQPAPPGDRTLARIRAAILYEDDAILVLDKPPGIAVHGGSGLKYGVIEALRALRPEARFLELVHRLDRETSGCLLIAKKRSALRHLHGLLRGSEIAKTYIALLKGRWAGGPERVDAALRKNVLSSGERIVRVQEAAGKEATTLFEPLARSPLATLVRALPATGRTHQIRVHAAHLDRPLAGDEKYGDPEFNRSLRGAGLRRLFLHASALRFAHPTTGDEIRISAPLAPDLVAVLGALNLKTPCDV